MNDGFSSQSVKTDIIERLQRHSSVPLCESLLEQFLNAEPVELVDQVHSIPAVIQFENYHIVLNDDTLQELIELTLRHPFKRQLFCYLCSYFDHDHQFVAFIHLAINSHIHLFRNHHLVISMFHKFATYVVRKWLIELMWHQDYHMQALYYISWRPNKICSKNISQEVFIDIIEFLLNQQRFSANVFNL